MKLHSSRNKKRIAILAVCCVLLVIAGILTFVLIDKGTNNDNTDVIEQSITLSSPPLKTEYYLGEEFDPTGTQIQVATNVNNKTYFVDHTKLTFEGFDSSTVNDALVITVSYMNFSTTFTVKIKDYPNEDARLESISLSDNFQTTYTKDWWNKYGPIFDNVVIQCTYTDGTTKDIALTRKYCSGVHDVETGGKTQFTVTYSEGGASLEIVVDITITE